MNGWLEEGDPPSERWIKFVKLIREIIDIILLSIQILAALIIAYTIFVGALQYNPTKIPMFNMWLFFTGVIMFISSSWLESKMEKKSKNESRSQNYEIRI